MNGFRYFLEVFNPNVDSGIAPELLPHYINDCLVRDAGRATTRPSGPVPEDPVQRSAALEELATFDPGLMVGVLGGGAGTARDTFELIYQAEKYGARLALFGRKINLAEDPWRWSRLMRAVADGDMLPEEAVRAYHGALQDAGQKPLRALADDSAITEKVLMGA